MLLITFAFASASIAAQRTFVASTGLDTHPCSIGAPCRSFGTAITHTDDGGEIIVLDSAGYGAVTIAKSVSIIAPPGIYAGISVFSGAGVTINHPLGTVVLRGLSINGQGGDVGIVVLAAGAVSIESCIVSGVKVWGILNQGGDNVRIVGSIVRFNGSAGIFSRTRLVVEDTQSDSNAGSGLYFVQGTSGIVRGSRFIANGGNGITVEDQLGTGPSITVSISDSELSGNVQHGFHVETNHASIGVTADRISASHNGMNGVDLFAGGGGGGAGVVNSAFSASQIAWNGNTGIYAVGTGVNHVVVSASAVNMNGSIGIHATNAAVIQISGNSIARNGDFDVQQSGTAVIHTFGNNALTAGGSDVSGTLTGVALK